MSSAERIFSPWLRRLGALVLVTAVCSGPAADAWSADEAQSGPQTPAATETANVPPAGSALPEGATAVGKTSKLSRIVKGFLGDQELPVVLAGDVFKNEIIKTGADSAAEVRFLDDTVLNIGPGSTMTLDEFVFDPAPGKGKVAVNATKGVFRFVSGKLASQAYEVKTPVATMGVRGTSFSIIVEDNGHTTVAVSDGEVEVANSEGASVFVEAGFSTSVNPPDESGNVTPPSPPAPAPPEVDEKVGNMDATLQKGESAPETAEADDGDDKGELAKIAEQKLAGSVLPPEVVVALEKGDLDVLKKYLALLTDQTDMAAALVHIFDAIQALDSKLGLAIARDLYAFLEKEFHETLQMWVMERSPVLFNIATAAGREEPAKKEEGDADEKDKSNDRDDEIEPVIVPEVSASPT